MNKELIENFIGIVRKYSPKCFVNGNNELIVEPKNNIYFRLDDIETELDLKCKILAWLSRPSCKGLSAFSQRRIRTIVNEFLGTYFTVDEMELIYTYLGNDCNRKKSIKFIKSGYNFKILPKNIKN